MFKFAILTASTVKAQGFFIQDNGRNLLANTESVNSAVWKGKGFKFNLDLENRKEEWPNIE